MEEEISGRQIGIKYGLILALVGSVVFIIPAALRINFGLMFLIYWAYFITILLFGLKEYKKGNGGFMSFGKGFGIAMTIAALGGLVRAVLRYVYLTVDSTYFDFVKEAQQNNPFGPPPQDSAQDVTAFTDMIMSPEGFALFSFLGAIFAGLIFGAITAAIVKNEEEEY